jgi:hypothetical protein
MRVFVSDNPEDLSTHYALAMLQYRDLTTSELV